MKQERKTNSHSGVEYIELTADEGKVLRRIEDQYVVGKSIALGYSYYRMELGTIQEERPIEVTDENGDKTIAYQTVEVEKFLPVKRDEPLLELPEHYEEIDEPDEPEPTEEAEIINEENDIEQPTTGEQK